MNKDLTTSQDSPELWKGYSLDELRYQKAELLTLIEIQKGKLLEKVQSSGSKVNFTSKGLTGIVMKKFLGNISFIDYIFIGFKVVKSAVKLIQLFRHKKFF